MTKEQQGFCGCLTLIAIVLLVGIGLRSANIQQFAVMTVAAMALLFIFLWALGRVLMPDAGRASRLVGLGIGIAVSVLFVTSLGDFLLTGNYDEASQLTVVRSWFTPQAASVPSGATPAPTDVQIIVPTATPAPTVVPTATAMPTATATVTPTATVAPTAMAQQLPEPVRAASGGPGISDVGLFITGAWPMLASMAGLLFLLWLSWRIRYN